VSGVCDVEGNAESSFIDVMASYDVAGNICQALPAAAGIEAAAAAAGGVAVHCAAAAAADAESRWELRWERQWAAS